MHASGLGDSGASSTIFFLVEFPSKIIRKISGGSLGASMGGAMKIWIVASSPEALQKGKSRPYVRSFAQT